MYSYKMKYGYRSVDHPLSPQQREESVRAIAKSIIDYTDGRVACNTTTVGQAIELHSDGFPVGFTVCIAHYHGTRFDAGNVRLPQERTMVQLRISGNQEGVAVNDLVNMVRSLVDNGKFMSER